MKRSSFRFALIVVVLAMIVGSLASNSKTLAQPTQSGPTLLKASLIVRANRLLHYWKVPEQDN